MTGPAGDRGARAALADAAARFGFSATPRLDAELLLAHVLGVERNRLLLTLDDVVVPAGFADLVARRVGQEPVAYLTGTRGFWTVDLMVGPGALVPRADSEILLVAALDHFGQRPVGSILDLGTGPGTLLLAALDEWRSADGLGVDRSAAALDYARANAAALGMGARARFMLGDWAAALDATFDLVLANPPYIGTDEILPDEVRGHEPAGALFAGTDGLDAYRLIAPQLRRLVAPGGVAIVEIGHAQGDAVSALLAAQGFATQVRHDYGDRPRAVVAT
ncbi:protein-(glutamine-N5) methyltransferase, release factor-specific [Sphingomonas sp. Leaf17]|uniref:peptide chain release factor N(5)-glutamine methyltransferase n=1 Tax=Sphingomonas sp. Leaf17 TaxID=1735683 RepID=UPI0006FCA7F4|nr:peptide chain release factor N(5)-glutamine methyltransferase [Sphingomonas sp. Leaf17]KQM62526.1 protein-(glutamine-N5) methyltransferase, release factor-specific [Sphingomonas sp. Leaf17]